MKEHPGRQHEDHPDTGRDVTNRHEQDQERRPDQLLYDNLPAPEDNLEMRNHVFAAAEFVLDVFECIWDYRDEYSAADRDSWREWIHNVFERSPTVRDLFVENEAWYPTLKSLAESPRLYG